MRLFTATAVFFFCASLHPQIWTLPPGDWREVKGNTAMRILPNNQILYTENIQAGEYKSIRLLLRSQVRNEYWMDIIPAVDGDNGSLENTDLVIYIFDTNTLELSIFKGSQIRKIQMERTRLPEKL